MKKITCLTFVLGMSLAGLVRADDIQFTTLPQPVQTTVIRETHIQNPTAVTHIIRSGNGVYAVTVHRDAGDQVVYVNPEGTIVQGPSTSTTTTVEQPAEGAVITYREVQDNQSRYQLLKKDGDKEVYLDRQTGQKVKVKREKD